MAREGRSVRETPVPRALATTIRTIADVRDAPASNSLLNVASTRSLRRWLKSAAKKLVEETGEASWNHFAFHDLRRTWATSLSASDVDPLLVCDWGGSNDLEIFLEHYRGTYSPRIQRRELGRSNGSELVLWSIFLD